MASIAVLRGSECLAKAEGAGEVSLLFKGNYQEGDELVFSGDTPYMRVKADACIESARLFMPERMFRYRVPLADDRLLAYPPQAFAGGRHLLSLAPDESNERRNLALNPLDLRESTGAFPHAEANVETRDESVFFARNVIDGVTIAAGHGEWPYESWGIGERKDPALTLNFGREVVTDETALYLRADFPHDSCWKQVIVSFSDGTSETFSLRRMDGAQTVRYAPRTVRWMRLENFVKDDSDPSPFPALRQWAVFGRDARR